MRLDRNQLAKDILLQHIDNLKSDRVCRLFATIKRQGGNNESVLARMSVEQADALIKELEK